MINRNEGASCPHCGYPNDGNTSVDKQGGEPQAGDYSICWGCAAVGIFNDDSTVRQPNEEEQKEIAADPFIQKHVSRIKDKIREWRMKNTH